MTIIWRRNNYTFYLSLLFVFYKICNGWILTIIYKLINYVLFASMSKLLWPTFRFKYYYKPYILAETHRQSSPSYRYYYYVVYCYACFTCRIYVRSIHWRVYGHIAIIWCYSSDLHIYVIIIIFGLVFTLFLVFLREFYLICHREGNEKYIQITGIYAYTVLGESSLCVHLRIFIRVRL